MKSLSQQQLKYLSETFQLGQSALQMGAFDKAEKHFSDVLKANPNITEAQASLAYVYTASKQHEKAIAQLKAMLQQAPRHAQTHFNLANVFYETKQAENAIKHFDLAIEYDPNFVNAYIHCGIAQKLNKNIDGAVKYLLRALALDKSNARALHLLGILYTELNDWVKAADAFEALVKLKPDEPQYHVSFAEFLSEAGLDFEAGLAFHHACELNPNYADSFIGYGEYLHVRHRHDEALECFNHAIELSSSSANMLDRLGKTYLGMGNVEIALEKFNLALSQEPQRISSLLGIGQAQLEVGNVDAVINIANQVNNADATLPNGHLLLSRAKKSSLDDGLAEHLLKFAYKEDLEETTKIATNFALGKVFDDQKKYADAFKYYDAGNSLRNNKLNYSTEADKARFSQLIETFNADFFKYHQHLGTDKNLPVLIVGMPRSGTTLTEQIISSHPNVIGAGEVTFWGRAPTAMPLRIGTSTEYPSCVSEITEAHAADIASMYEATLQKIAGPNTKPAHITDKMPHNFLSVGLIALLFPNVKIIHTKRDPIDTCLSIFFQNFNDAHPYAFDLSNLGFHYKQYERIMQHWHEVLPGRILDVNYEDTIANPEFWSRKLIAHIGLEWDDACLAPHKLERTVKTASHWQVRQPIYKTSVQRWKKYEGFLGPLKEALGITD